MRLFEQGRLAEAADAFGTLTGASGDGCIAQFRRAEALSRLGRHDEAIEDARTAYENGRDEPPAPLWYAQALAEADRFEEAAGVAFPDSDDEELRGVRAGFGALAALARNDLSDRAGTISTLLATRHHPLFSLARRVAERSRLAAPPTGPDLYSTFMAAQALYEADDAMKQVHPSLEALDARPRRMSPARWIRLADACGTWEALHGVLRPHMETSSGDETPELEDDISLGRLDAAREALEAAAGRDGESRSLGRKHVVAGTVCVDLCRVRHLQGDFVLPGTLPGYDIAGRALRPLVTWLELVVALHEDRPQDARRSADAIADPSHEEFVEAALYRWSMSLTAGNQS
jgi:tetratricopeptide (TPR) repeat protein